MYDALDKRWLKSTCAIALIAANIVLHILCIFMRSEIHAIGVLDVNAVAYRGEYNRLITSMFLHADISHLFSNMVILMYIGGVVEMNIGHIRFVILYFISGIMGNILTVVYEISRYESWTSLGASGAVFGVMGAMLVLIIKAYRRYGISKNLTGRVVFMVAYSFFAGLTRGGVNNIAHFGGLATGIISGLIMTLHLKTLHLEALGYAHLTEKEKPPVTPEEDAFNDDNCKREPLPDYPQHDYPPPRDDDK